MQEFENLYSEFAVLHESIKEHDRAYVRLKIQIADLFSRYVEERCALRLSNRRDSIQENDRKNCT